MAKILKFPSSPDPKSQKLKELADAIDAAMQWAIVEQGLKPHEVAGLLAHRLGSLMKPLGLKNQVWGFCERVMRRQASID